MGSGREQRARAWGGRFTDLADPNASTLNLPFAVLARPLIHATGLTDLTDREPKRHDPTHDVQDTAQGLFTHAPNQKGTHSIQQGMAHLALQPV